MKILVDNLVETRVLESGENLASLRARAQRDTSSGMDLTSSAHDAYPRGYLCA